ncbi:Uncharacterized protein TCM_009703 [Theobroma cacao]|uniref:Uncharacterized protein n=1 Tax=Theobroma cacao TaxID=3641 RepID=A0A061E591_THECC|nr:Uncharacterized protein TCM_009703 [Theobroma cacao]
MLLTCFYDYKKRKGNTKKYSAEPSGQPKFDPKAWTEAIGWHTTTQTYEYESGTRVPALRLLVAIAMFEFAYGLNDAPPPMPKLEGHRQLLTDVKTLMTGCNTLNNLLMEVIGATRAQPEPNTFRASLSW